jgi:hypothetical protein
MGGLSRQNIIMPAYGTLSYAFNNIVYTTPMRTYDYKKMFGFFENGSYMEMTNPLLAKDDKCFLMMVNFTCIKKTSQRNHCRFMSMI